MRVKALQFGLCAALAISGSTACALSHRVKTGVRDPAHTSQARTAKSVHLEAHTILSERGAHTRPEARPLPRRRTPGDRRVSESSSARSREGASAHAHAVHGAPALRTAETVRKGRTAGTDSRILAAHREAGSSARRSTHATSVASFERQEHHGQASWVGRSITPPQAPAAARIGGRGASVGVSAGVSAGLARYSEPAAIPKMTAQSTAPPASGELEGVRHNRKLHFSAESPAAPAPRSDSATPGTIPPPAPAVGPHTAVPASAISARPAVSAPSQPFSGYSHPPDFSDYDNQPARAASVQGAASAVSGARPVVKIAPSPHGIVVQELVSSAGAAAAPLPAPVASVVRVPAAPDDLSPKVHSLPSSVPSVEQQVLENRVIPSLFNDRGQLMMPAALKGSHEILLHQNIEADREGLSRIRDDQDLARMRGRHELVPLPQVRGLQVDERLPMNRRFARSRYRSACCGRTAMRRRPKARRPHRT